jgi:putative transposase
MSYGLDLRKKVIDYVENRGSITKAAALFNIVEQQYMDGVRREKLEATKVKHRQRKLDWKARSKNVQENPEARLRDPSREVWSETKCHLLCLKENESYQKKEGTSL